MGAKKAAQKIAKTGYGKAADFLSDSILHSNQPVNKLKGFSKTARGVGDFVLGSEKSGIIGTLRGMDAGDDLWGAVKKAHRTKDGAADIKAIAGTYIGLGVAGRFATGGGLYRDKNGNVNLPGVPFI